MGRLTAATNRREAKYENLSVPRLPMVEIDAEASHILPANVIMCIHKAKEALGLITAKKWRIQELNHPIHLVSVGEIKGDLDVLIRVFNHDDAIVTNARVLPFAFEEDGATWLYFSCAKASFFEG